METNKTPRKITDLIDYRNYTDFMLFVKGCHNLVFDTDIFVNYQLPDYDDIDTMRGGCLVALNHVFLKRDFEVPTKQEQMIIDEKCEGLKNFVYVILAHYLNWCDSERNNSTIWWYNENYDDIEWFTTDDFTEVFKDEDC